MPSGFRDGRPGGDGPNHSQSGDPNAMPAPGELGLVEKRTWKTWQLACAVIVGVLIGMALNYHKVGASRSDGSSGSNGYKLPPPSGSSGTTTTAAVRAATGATTTTTSAGN